jgi:uncharacterized membrane protein YfcA
MRRNWPPSCASKPESPAASNGEHDWKLIASVRPRLQPARVTKLCIFVGTTVGSYAGWAVGDNLFNLGFGWAFVISGVGSIVGVYAGWKLAQKLSD